MKTNYKSLYLFILLILAMAASCSNRIHYLGVHYLGESYPAKEKVEVFYNDADVTRVFRTIGHALSAEFKYESEVEKRRLEVVIEAKKRGADAVIFDSFETIADNDGLDDLRLRARLVKYTD